MSTQNTPVFKDFPYYPVNNIEDVKRTITQITNTRKDDIDQIGNLTNIFIQGRSVGRVPSSSTDVIAGDKIGDFSVTTTFAYFLVNNAGSGEWRRVAVGAF